VLPHFTCLSVVRCSSFVTQRRHKPEEGLDKFLEILGVGLITQQCLVVLDGDLEVVRVLGLGELSTPTNQLNAFLPTTSRLRSLLRNYNVITV